MHPQPSTPSPHSAPSAPRSNALQAGGNLVDTVTTGEAAFAAVVAKFSGSHFLSDDDARWAAPQRSPLSLSALCCASSIRLV